MLKRLICWAFCVAWLPAAADTIYKYVDEQGNVTYSNVKVPGARPVVIDATPVAPVTRPSEATTRSSNKPKSAAAAPSNFPRVDPDTQRRRDDQRRQILADELKSEERALEQAKVALKEGEGVRLGGERNYQKYLDRVQALKDNVTQHEKNVQALKKELGQLK